MSDIDFSDTYREECLKRSCGTCRWFVFTFRGPTNILCKHPDVERQLEKCALHCPLWERDTTGE